MKSTIKPTLLAALLMGGALAALPVLAQDASPKGDVAAPHPGAFPGPRQGPAGEWPPFNLKSFDANADGSISLTEIEGKRKAEAAALDANGDGKLSAEELVNDEIARIRPAIEARVQARIKAQDSDGDGLLSAAELAMPPLPEGLFERIDADGDGVITAEEMRAAHEKMMHRMEARMEDRGPMGRPGDNGNKGGDRRGPDQGSDHGPDRGPGHRPGPAPDGAPADGDAN
ncbi:MAG TPA: hypothetical protein VGC31_08730 [Paenirhodobacter sp.]